MAQPGQAIRLVRPSLEHLPGYVDALNKGWTRDNLRGDAARLDELAAIESDARAFVEGQVNREAKGPRIKLPDGSTIQRLPGYVLWIWDGEFCGAIGFRWQPGTALLPAHVPGHIGYGIVPWKRGRGYAKRALALMLEHARAEGLDHVEITADADNVASRRVIEANGGVVVERFVDSVLLGGQESIRYRLAI